MFDAGCGIAAVFIQTGQSNPTDHIAALVHKHDRIDAITELSLPESTAGVFDLYLTYKLRRL